MVGLELGEPRELLGSVQARLPRAPQGQGSTRHAPAGPRPLRRSRPGAPGQTRGSSPGAGSAAMGPVSRRTRLCSTSRSSCGRTSVVGSRLATAWAASSVKPPEKTARWRKTYLLVWSQEAVAPGDGVAHRSLARRCVSRASLEEGKAVLKPIAQRRRSEHPDPRGGQFDGERQPVESRGRSRRRPAASRSLPRIAGPPREPVP